MNGALLAVIPVAISIATLLLSQRNVDTTRRDSASRDWVEQLEKRVELCEQDRSSLRASMDRIEEECVRLRLENRDLLVKVVQLQADKGLP